MNSAFSAAMIFSELIYPSPMQTVTDPQFYYTFSKYYLCNNSTASLLAITEFRQLNPLHSFKNILLLSTQSGNKKKTNMKKEEGKKAALCPGLWSTIQGGLNPRKDKYTSWGRRKPVWKQEAKQHFNHLFCVNKRLTGFNQGFFF